MSKNPACPVCRRIAWFTRESLAEHMAADHSIEVVVAELLNRVHPPINDAERKRCARKIRYRTFALAMHALVETWRSASPLRKEDHPYQCPVCGDWHLTSQKRPGAHPAADEVTR